MKCTNCGNELAAGAAFCEECGAAVSVVEEKDVTIETTETTAEKVEETQAENADVQKTAESGKNVFCTNCGTSIPAGSDFCHNCGAGLASGAAAGNNATKPAKKKGISGAVIGIAVALVVVVVALFAGSLLFGGGKSNKADYTFYIKDKEVFYYVAGKKATSQITEEFVAEGDVGNSGLASVSQEMAYYFVKSDDGKTIFFPDKIDYSDNGLNIYHKKLSKLNKEGVKIDSDVLAYSVNEAANLVTYITNEDDLYSYNIKKEDRVKISSDVEKYEVSADGKKAYFLNSDDELYYWTQSKGKDKVDSDVTKICYNTDDFKTIYYLKDDSFYKKTQGKDKEKIASEVVNVLKVYDSGAAYYIKDNSESQSVLDYVYDDKAEEDLNLVAPEWPKSPSRSDFSSSTAYDAAVEEYNKAKEEYEQKYQEYEQKIARDYMRESLENDMEFYLEKYELCYYDGKDTETITEGLLGKYDYSIASSEEVIVYPAIDEEAFEKVKLSKFNSVYALETEITSALTESAKHYVASENKVSVIESETGCNYVINASGDRIMFYDDVDTEKSEGDLYIIKVNNGKLSTPELYDSEVYTGNASVSSDYIYYYKDYENRNGDLYIDKKQADYEVYSGVLRYDSDNDTFYYYVDYDTSKGEGTLKAYKKGKTEKIADDVSSYQILDGDVYYIRDFSTKSYKGELYYYNGRKSVKVDDDVVSLMGATVSKSLQGGAYRYGW